MDRTGNVDVVGTGGVKQRGNKATGRNISDGKPIKGCRGGLLKVIHIHAR